MAPVDGRPFLEYQLDYWIGQGIERAIISVGHKREVIRSHFGPAYRGIPIAYAVEETPLGTGGGLLLAAKLLPDDAPFVLLNGDTFFEVDLAALRRFHAQHGSDWTFSLFRSNEAGRYMGVDVGPDGRIRAFQSGRSGAGTLANGGVYLVEPALLRRCPFRAGDKASLEDEILPALQADGGCFHAVAFEGRFIDIGVPADYLRAAWVIR
jgi:Nucleoside-diphosphate-sugar pyrophosphorylase involved in lipopolysaccharide biosynthesis/translation initiation factor 2B, gamma/epsilon subunits (eIF-2Bgamma/eIF-2Bepsilon)